MKVPAKYLGPLRYHRSMESSDSFLERVLEEEMQLKIDNGEAFSLHLLFEDYGERKLRSLPYVDSESFDLAWDWYHEVQEGLLVLAQLRAPHQPFIYHEVPDETLHS